MGVLARNESTTNVFNQFRLIMAGAHAKVMMHDEVLTFLFHLKCSGQFLL